MEIQDLMREIRKNALERIERRSPYDLATTWSQEDLFYSGRGKAIFMILPTSGCAWALSESGGCTMCSYIADSPLEDVPADILTDIFKKFIEKYEINEKTAVKIFTSGSFLNNEEFPKEARLEILNILKHEENIEEIVVESRPEYVTENVLEECCKASGDKIFEVSIGLETADDYIRKYKINKGFSKKDFENAINIIKKMKTSCNIKSKVYLLIKPILTSEMDAIEDAVKSAQYAEKIGIDRISFCPATIHKGTLMELLWRRGSYQPPWIWSILEIIKRVRSSVKIPVIMDTSGFGTRRGPFNCKKCNSKLKKMIIESNLNQTIPDEFECECKNRWTVDVEFSNVTRSTISPI
ncbi:MAG: TIGR01210 family radical SAM protein [Euryarchaeota archaeon]|nr:TIGR01210 family radical SAM protein [Euryarchaeota archaeon]